MREAFDVVVVGGGLAAANAIETMIAKGIAGARIALVASENELPYSRPPLSKGYLLDREDRASVFAKPRKFYDDAHIRLFLGVSATGVDPAAHTVTTARGDVLRYGRLLLAQGCGLRKLTVPGSDLPGIFYLRTLADADALKAAIPQARTAVVVGGSFIGMELASAFSQKGLKTTVLHRGTAIFDKLGSPEASAFFTTYFSDHGVTIETEDEAAAVERGSPSGLLVRTKRGRAVPGDIVAVGIGVVPHTDFLLGSDITVENGIVVNEYLEASAPDVYAAGDVANFLDPLYGRQRRIEHWDTAIQHGKVAGANIAARDASARVPYSAVSYFFSDIFDLSFEYFGDATGTDRAVLRGSFQEKAVSVFSFQGNIVRAAFTMGRPRERRQTIGLIQRRAAIADLGALADAAKPLPAPR